MARITRKTQKIFGSAAADVGQFGSAALGTKLITLDPAVIQALAAYTGGWLPAVLGANKFPALEEMNGVELVNTYQLSYLFQEGISEYDAGTTYYQHSVVKQAGTYNIYGSVTDNNIGNLLTDPTNWLLLGSLANLNNTNAFQSIKITKFTTSGTWTPDALNLFSIVKMVGAGGGSAGTAGNSGSPGGGAGGYLEALITKAQASTSQAATIGAAGTAGGAGANNGGAGGTTSLGSLLSCTGGNPSNFVTAGSSTTVMNPGGTGGAPTITTGSEINKRNGGQGGMGGQSATSVGGTNFGGYGASSPLGDGGSQVYSGSPPTNNSAANTGTGYGAGGGGCADSSGTPTAGAAGQAGYIEIIEFLS